MAQGLKTGGRKKGIPNKLTAQRQALIAAGGQTPLEYLLHVMRTSTVPSMQLEAAKAAAPYVHPKLANIEMTGKDGGPLQIRIVRFADDQPA